MSNNNAIKFLPDENAIKLAELVCSKATLCNYCKEINAVDCKGCKVADLVNHALDENDAKKNST